MAKLFGPGPSTQASQGQSPASALRLQSSALGKAWTRIYGTTRIAPNVLWAGDFQAIPHVVANQTQGGGKGGSGSQGSFSVNYTYQTALALGLCEGPILKIGQVFVDKSVYASIDAFGFTAFLGTFPQSPWAYLETHHQQINEDRTIPVAPGPYVIAVQFTEAPFVDGGVVDAAGNVFTAVGGAPGPQQYNVANGIYTFNAGDAGTEVTITYQAANQQPPNEALAYPGFAYVAASAYGLGTSADLPNHNFEVFGLFSDSVPGQVDADASLVVADLLTSPHHGIGFPANRLFDLTNFQNYTLAAGLLLSVAYSDQKATSEIINDICTATNSAPVWTTGLAIIPYGDEEITGNGKTYTPPLQPLVDLSDDDFVPNQGSSGSAAATTTDPVQIWRPRQADAINSVKAEFLNRATNYAPEPVQAKDQAAISQFGLRESPSQQAHMFASGSAARTSVQLALQRQAVRNQFTFTLDDRFGWLDPMDIVTLTVPAQFLDHVWVRLTEIDETDDGAFVCTAEQYLQGTGAAALYSFQQGAGFTANTNIDPGSIEPPIIFEPTDELGGGLFVWAAVCGVDPATWGGCDVWASTEADGNYENLGRILGPARMGELVAPLAAVATNATGQTIDTANTLSVDVSVSEATLLSGSQADALALNTRCYVDGEIIAYQTATLTGAGKYDLTYLVRGAYGTEARMSAGPHAAGSKFARLDQGVFALPFDQDRIGSTIYLKFPSFNLYGGALQSLADVPFYAYQITGVALASPLPNVENLTSKFVDGRLNITWDEIEDFRNGIRYEIRRGDTFEGALSLGTVAHPPFACPGDGTYWVTAWCQPTAGLVVRSEIAESIDVVGATLNNNIVATFDCKAQGWPGVFVNAGVDSGLNAVRTAASGNVLDDPDALSETDLLNLGGEVSGVYRPRFIVDIGRVAPVAITITLQATGVPVGADALNVPDILAQPDILGSASAAFVDVFANVYVSQDGVGSILTDPDVLTNDDVLSYGIPFGAAQKYSPGTYVGRVFAFDFPLTTIDPQTIALLLEAKITVDALDRVDSRALIGGAPTTLTNVAVPGAGIDLVFLPNGSDTAAPFNGGADGTLNSLPQIIVTWGDEQPGDVLEITNETLAGVHIRIVNGGVGVARNKVNIYPRGF